VLWLKRRRARPKTAKHIPPDKVCKKRFFLDLMAGAPKEGFNPSIQVHVLTPTAVLWLKRRRARPKTAKHIPPDKVCKKRFFLDLMAGARR